MSEPLIVSVSRQEALEDLFDKIVEHIELNESTMGDFLDALCSIYSDDTFRHSYSRISLALSNLSPDQRDSLSDNLQHMVDESDEYLKVKYESPQKRQDIKSKISKLHDHIELERLRIARIDRVELIGNTAHDDLTAADGKLKETEEKAKELGERIGHIQGQSITILGIFAGLVITFSAVMQLSSIGLSGFSQSSAFRITFFISFVSLFLFNIIFLLLYCVAKIAGSSIAVKCKKSECINCNACKTWIGKGHKKYPYMFWFNIIGAIICAILFVIAFICKAQ